MEEKAWGIGVMESRGVGAFDQNETSFCIFPILHYSSSPVLQYFITPVLLGC